MATEQNTSNTTILRHDSWAEDTPEEQNATEDGQYHNIDEGHEARERQIDRIQAEIKAAARAVVASIEQDNYRGNEDSVLSMQTDESYDVEASELTYDEPDMSYGSDNEHREDGEHVDGTEVTYDSGNEEVSELNPDLDASEVMSERGNEETSESNHNMDTSEVIYEHDHEANTPVVDILEEADTGLEESLEESVEKRVEASIEEDKQVIEDDHTEQNIDQAAEIDQETSKECVMPVASVEDKYEEEHISENDRGGDSSSHHDGDLDDDDVFSHNSSHSARSSLNSALDLQRGEDTYSQKALTSPTVGEEANTRRVSDAMSRIPSSGSYMNPIPDAALLQDTPTSKVLSRPPFRTPSSVRAMQMSSPTPSIYNSPRSIKRHLPTVSRIGTPTSNTSKNRTPTRFKAKKEQPLVLLHVTVLPLQWLYSHLTSSLEFPESLQYVKENWRLLQDKLGDTVLERGILLPHPQDSFEVLEERLLEALELPVRPRALILKCGHYIGPADLDITSSEDDEGGDYWNENITRRKWCDICRREVRFENNNEPEGKRFRVKIYASNGLMHAGAWAAAWKEMERVDVEIAPWVEPHQHTELEELALLKPKVFIEEHDDGFEDEPIMDGVEEPVVAEQEQALQGAIDNQREPVPEDIPEIEQVTVEKVPAPEEAPVEREKSVADYENEMRELLLEEERMKELHERESERPEFLHEEQRMKDAHERERLETKRPKSKRAIPDPIPERPQSSFSTNSSTGINEASLSELLVAAFKVAMRDTKNIAIVVLSILVILLALRPGATPQESLPAISSPASTPDLIVTSVAQPTVAIQESMVSVTSPITETASSPRHHTIETPIQATKKVEQRPLKAKRPAKKAEQRPLKATKPAKIPVKRSKANASKTPVIHASKVAQETPPLMSIVVKAEEESAAQIEEVIGEPGNPQHVEADSESGEVLEIDTEIEPTVYRAGKEEADDKTEEEVQDIQAQADLGAHADGVEVDTEEFVAENMEEVEKEMTDRNAQFPYAVVTELPLSDEDPVSPEDLQESSLEYEEEDEAEEDPEVEDEL